MNVLLWILQVGLAFMFLAGGAYKAYDPGDVAKQVRAVPAAGWRAIGVLEVVGGVLLVAPAALSWMPGLTPIAAAALTLESAALAALYARTSTKLVAANPLVYVVPMGVVAAVVAVGRASVGAP